MDLNMTQTHGPLLEIYRVEGQLLVKVWPDGRIEYGEDYTPDEAAHIFWTTLAKVFDPTLPHMPGEVALQGHAILKIVGQTPGENQEDLWFVLVLQKIRQTRTTLKERYD